MPIKKGTKIHKYTEEDFRQIKAGKFLPGIDRRSQVYALKRHEDRKAQNRVKFRKYREPEMPVWHGYEYSTGEWV